MSSILEINKEAEAVQKDASSRSIPKAFGTGSPIVVMARRYRIKVRYD